MIRLISILLIFLFAGCGSTKPATQEEAQHLEEAKQAAINAEKKLSDLRLERENLEKQLKDQE